MSSEIRRSERIKKQERIDYKTFKMVSDSDDNSKKEDEAFENKTVSKNKNTEGNSKTKDKASSSEADPENKNYEDSSKKTDETTQDEKNSIARENENSPFKSSEVESNFYLIKEEIEDYIDEFPINRTTHSIEDIETCIEKISQLRTEFRMITKNLARTVSASKFDSSYSKEKDETLSIVKEYIINANERKTNIRAMESASRSAANSKKSKKEESENNQMRQAALFLINEVKRITKELFSEFSKNRTKEVSDEEIVLRKEDLPANLLKLEQLSTKFQRCLEIVPDNYEGKEDIINALTQNYNDLLSEKKSHELFINSEIKLREIAKEKSFQVSSLNINLSKFSGYDSELDIYTFQFEFEKLYLKTTPKKMLPDLLKYNYLNDPALALVKCVDSIDEMWLRLKKAYGDPKTLLANKLSAVKKVGPLWKVSGDKLMSSLMSLINGIKDLITLAKYHKIEAKLFHGDGLDMIYSIMGETRVTKWISKTCEKSFEEEELWNHLIIFLEKELRVQQELSHVNKKYLQEPKIDSSHLSLNTPNASVVQGSSISSKDQSSSHVTSTPEEEKSCSFCNEKDHYITVGLSGSKSVHYYSCPKFVSMNPLERFKELRRLGFCYQCLLPGAIQNNGKHENGTCQSNFTCKHPSHDRYRRKHVLVCQEHSGNDENKKILENYKEKYIMQRPNIPEFSKDIKLSFVAKQSYVTPSIPQDLHSNDDIRTTDNGIYLLQKIQVDGNEYTIFFDTGCSDMVSRHSAIQRIGSRAKLEVKGPISLGGVGNLKTESQHGIYQVRLPLVNGNNAVLTGVCLDQITNTFPIYPIDGEIYSDIIAAYSESGKDESELPKLPSTIGGDVDFMIGTKYLRYHPKPIFTMASGLTIYESPFTSPDGVQGVIGGPHSVITEIDKIHHNNQNCQHAYLSNHYKLYQIGYKLDPDIYLLSIKHSKDVKNEMATQVDKETNKICEMSCYMHETVIQKHFEEVENAASEILYRCINCRNCQNCKNADRTENISIQEEVEQNLINQSITVHLDVGKTEAKLPLLQDAAIKLAPNKKRALAVYKSQVKRLESNTQDKADVIASEAKLQSLGHVDYVKNLTKEQQQRLSENTVQNYIPWTTVWKDNSVSTPCRIVFNASMPTDSKFSLNDILAKGKNNMNKLVEIILRWRTHQFGFHSDVAKMYNTVQLREEDWCLQRYIWQENLDPRYIPEEKVIKTLIYGVKSSGNQAEHALRLTASLSKNEFQEANNMIQNDVYVDDCMSGENSIELCHKRADEINLVLTRGGFSLKGFTFSKSDPPQELSQDTKSINVAGMKWFSKKDYIMLDISPIDFSKRKKGKKKFSMEMINGPSRRQCLSMVASVFDLTGMLTPITAGLKLDLHELVKRKLQWDDPIPDDLKPIWCSNFEMIEELQSFKFERAVVPVDAKSLAIDTIECADASRDIACVAIYVRFLRKCGEYSCQLIFARSKLVPDGMSIPRAELFAANINAHTGEVVKRSLKKYHKSRIKLTDSQVTLHWLHNQELHLKQWVRNRVVEILRFTKPSEWFYIPGKDMPADIGTRKGITLSDISVESIWQKGFEWMGKHKSAFPIKSYEEIKSICLEASSKSNELIENTPSTVTYLSNFQDKILPYYEFSNYLIDPNKFRFTKVVRILALVKLFIKNCKLTSQGAITKRDQNTVVKVSDNEFADASKYFYYKATEEVKKFCSTNVYEKISQENEGILYYTGRILPNQKITNIETIIDTMKDLSSLKYHVPLVDKHSPIAYSIVNEVHWNDSVANHSGNETVLRYTLDYAYILGGRDLVSLVRKECVRCKFLQKKTISVSMGPVSDHSLTIAPAFYVSQADIVGPFKAYSSHNKRTTIKIYMLVFCCSTTSTTNIKVMEDYSTTSFVQAFIRLACEVGYPKILLIDEGSQLVKGCEQSRFNYRDTEQILYKNSQVEFEVCPVGGHNMHGKVERKIRAVRESVEKTMQGERLSLMQWETLSSQISNSINDMPLFTEASNSSHEMSNLITPNRLKLGRNNSRSPSGALSLTSDPHKIIESNKKIFSSWFQTWIEVHVPKLMLQPKWHDSDRNLDNGDIVLFLKSEKELCDDYQYGQVVSINKGTDGKVRSAEIQYQNSNEKTKRTTNRAARQLVKIYSINDLDILKELGEVATYVDMKTRMLNE